MAGKVKVRLLVSTRGAKANDVIEVDADQVANLEANRQALRVKAEAKPAASTTRPARPRAKKAATPKPDKG